MDTKEYKDKFSEIFSENRVLDEHKNTLFFIGKDIMELIKIYEGRELVKDMAFLLGYIWGQNLSSKNYIETNYVFCVDISKFEISDGNKLYNKEELLMIRDNLIGLFSNIK